MPVHSAGVAEDSQGDWQTSSQNSEQRNERACNDEVEGDAGIAPGLNGCEKVAVIDEAGKYQTGEEKADVGAENENNAATQTAAVLAMAASRKRMARMMYAA